MDFEDNLKEEVLLENGKKYLINMIDALDKESFKVFGDVIDLNIETIGNIDSLDKRIIYLNEVLTRIKDIIENFDFKEQVLDNRSSTKLLLKGLFDLCIFTVIYTISPLLGILSMAYMVIKLLDKAKAIELKKKLEDKNSIDTSRLKLIESTLENSKNLLEGKKKQLVSNVEKQMPIVNNYGNDYLYNYCYYPEEETGMKLILK